MPTQTMDRDGEIIRCSKERTVLYACYTGQTHRVHVITPGDITFVLTDPTG